MRIHRLVTFAALAAGCSSDPATPVIDAPPTSPFDAPPLPDATVANPSVLWLNDLGSESNLRLVAVGPPPNF